MNLRATTWRSVWSDFDIGREYEREVRFVRVAGGEKRWEIKKTRVSNKAHEITMHIVPEGDSLSDVLGTALAETGERPPDIEIGFLAGFSRGEAESWGP